MAMNPSEHGQRAAFAFWSPKTPEERKDVAAGRLLKASVTTLKKRAGELSDDQAAELIYALAARAVKE